MLLSYLKLGLREMMAFRLGFVLNIVRRLVTSMEFVFFWLVLMNFRRGSVGGWRFEDLLFLVGFYELNLGIFMVFALGFFMLPLDISSGKLDDILILPISPSTGIIGNGLSPDNFVRIVVAVIIIAAAAIIHPALNPLLFLLGFVLAVLGSVLENIFFMSLNLLAFWFGDIGAVVESLSELDEAKRFPLDSVGRGTRFLLTFVVPVVFISSFPTEVITRRVTGAALFWGAVALFGMLVLWWYLFKLLWRRGLRNYQSGGSL